MDELTNGFEAGDFAPEQTMELLLTELPTTIRYFCRKHRNQLHPDEEDDLRQQIFLYLIEDNCRRLRTYDSGKASFKTWLHVVVEHEINHYLRRQKKLQCLDEMNPDSFAYEDSQESRILYREQKSRLVAMFGINELGKNSRVRHRLPK